VRQGKSGYHGMMDQGLISERGFNHMLDCVAAMKEVLGDKVSLALDCGPGWMLPDAIKFARAVEKYNLMWLEDMLTGDYVPWVNPQVLSRAHALDRDADPHRRADLPAA
jgi:L-alanine-DL-glutamate epimerase-like enolase superfamily enzyme